jgi:hypothetical protein
MTRISRRPDLEEGQGLLQEMFLVVADQPVKLLGMAIILCVCE